MSQANQLTLDPTAVRQQLERILAHRLFAKSGRMARFLRLAVERTLDGAGDDLKEYLIGVEVFDRSPSYDPRMDPIVRVEARRLRSKLKAYYQTDGCTDPVVIEFPPGNYAAQFRGCEPAPAPQPQPPTAPFVATITIAVLPFVNLSGNPENEYWSDGLTEELIHTLTRLGGMRVVAWNSAAKLRDRQQDLAAIRDQLKVATAMTGSVRVAGSSLRVRSQLIDTETGVYLWSETFDREIADAPAIQQEIAMAIVRTLRVQFATGNSLVSGRPGGKVGAYDWYLKGRYCMHLRSPDALARSVKCFENSLAIDPDCALANAGLADAYTLTVDYGITHPSEAMPKAKAAAARAIEIDPELAEAYASMALIRGLYDWDWDDSERLYRRSISLNPGYATAYQWLGVDHYAMVGRLDEALSAVEAAIQLDPLSSIIHENRAYLLMLSGRYEESLAAYRGIVAQDPTFYKAYTSMGRTYAQQGKYAEALAMLEKGRSLSGEMPNILSAMGQVAAMAGDTARARTLLADLHRLAITRYVPSPCFALVHLGLGETSRALDYLETACDSRELSVVVVKMHPAYDGLRGEARFDAILKRLHLI